MPEPIIELIAEDIKDRINEITEVNGFHQDLVAVRPVRNDFKDIAPTNGVVLVWQEDDDSSEDQAVGTQEWLQAFSLIAIVIDSDKATTSIDTKLNRARADIEKKLKASHTRGGYAIDTKFIGGAKFDGGAKFSGIVVNIVVHYRTDYSDPSIVA